MKNPILTFVNIWLLLGSGLICADQSHWAFTRLIASDIPDVDDENWCRDDLDRFVFIRQQEIGVNAVDEASPRQLVRRVFYDLTGLPPSPEEVETYLRDESTDRYEALIDKLLASPRYGERWGRHWLDVARYADSLGYRFDDDIPHAWTFRDFVIRALNENMPYDQFVKWQIAGDELAPDDRHALSATGFLCVGPRPRIEGNALNKKEARYIEIDDMVGTTFSAFLGLSMSCARCHDHKFDPISQKEYYSVAKAFLSGKRKSVPYLTPEENAVWDDWNSRDQQVKQGFKAWRKSYAKEFDVLVAEKRAPLAAERKILENLVLAGLEKGDEPKDTDQLKRIVGRQGKRIIGKERYERWKDLRKQIEGMKLILLADRETLKNAMSAPAFEEWQRLQDKRHAIDQEKPEDLAHCIAFVEGGKKVEPSFLMDRGSVAAPLEEVELGFLSILTEKNRPLQDIQGAAPSTYQRTQLANWITDVKFGAGALLARVMVNRVWQKHFGKGLVNTPDDFGIQAEKPMIPGLLDHLAGDFISSGWDLKALHKKIMLSATYRLGTDYNETAKKLDPGNQSLWRREPIRLEGEILRDAILQVSGRLDLEMYGPAVHLPIPKEVIISRLGNPYPEIHDGPKVWRRSVYAYHKRTVPVPFFQVFDSPNGSEPCGRRIQTTVATQALTLMNGSFTQVRAADLAKRVMASHTNDDVNASIAEVHRLALGREATTKEKEIAKNFIAGEKDFATGFEHYCRVILNLNEFLFID